MSSGKRLYTSRAPAVSLTCLLLWLLHDSRQVKRDGALEVYSLGRVLRLQLPREHSIGSVFGVAPCNAEIFACLEHCSWRPSVSGVGPRSLGTFISGEALVVLQSKAAAAFYLWLGTRVSGDRADEAGGHSL